MAHPPPDPESAAPARLDDRLARAIIACAPDGILLVDAQGTIRLANPAMQALCGRGSAELLGQNLDIFLPDDRQAAHRVHLQGYLDNPVRRPMGLLGNLALRHQDGRMLPVDVAVSPCETPDGPATVVFVRDLSEFKRLESKMHYHATLDGLTGLVNRWLFHEYLTQAVKRATRGGGRLGLLLLDLDDFKSINDRYGHATGDKALQEVARRLAGVIRAGDVLARQGGDEFMVLLQQLNDASDAAAVADKLVDALAVAAVIDGHAVRLHASVGWTLCPEDSQDVDALMRCADAAMYQAKRSGGNRSTGFGRGPSLSAMAMVPPS